MKEWGQKNISSMMDMSRFSVAEQEKHKFEHYVQLTSELIDRKYFATFKLVESWPIDKIIRRYEECTKHAGTMPGNVKWWWLRKQEKEANQKLLKRD